jgi:hypothetical protein
MLQAMSGPVAQELQRNGYNFDPAPLLRRIFTDGLGFRGFEQVVKKMDPGQMAAMGGGMGGPPGAAPQGPPAPTGIDRVRSALEQVTGQENAPDMVPGEGEEFMQVRANADEIAGNYPEIDA